MTAVLRARTARNASPLPPPFGWRVSPLPSSGDAGVAVCEQRALGTTAHVVVWPHEAHVAVCDAVDRVLDSLDRQVSRFRTDSELVRAEHNPGSATLLSQGAAEALTIALAAACVTGGLVTPTVGAAVRALGYDRDFAAIRPGAGDGGAGPAPSWRGVELVGRVLRVAPGLRLDLGATAKGLGADRSAWAALDVRGARGVLVGLGGDVAAAGEPPRGGWPIGVAEDPVSDWRMAAEVVRLASGGLATSSVLHRRWRNAKGIVHHIVDPSTGEPVEGRWRTATVAARTCAEANTASTAAIVAGDDAEAWLADHGLPGRLVDHEGAVHLVGGWPEHADGVVPVVPWSIFDGRAGAVRR
jgi:thiamine biosynthesis lipoprotein